MGRPSGDSGAVGRSRRQRGFFGAAPVRARPPPATKAWLPAVPDAVAPDAQALARLLGALPSSAPGAAAPVAAPPGRFALIGVLSGPRRGRRGAARCSAPGGAARVAAPPGRFALIGVRSGRRSGGGAALIAVDGKPARPFRIGAAVDQGLLLQPLAPRQARLGPHMGGPATVILDMPPRDQELPRP